MLVSKLPDKGTTIFTVMSKMAADYGAINLSQGFPDFQAPEALLERVAFYTAAGYNQYAPMSGVPALKQQIAMKVADLYGRNVNPDTEITVTPGATEALFCAVCATIHPGDEAIIFDPAYDTYEPAVTLNGGITHHIPMGYPDFQIDWQAVRCKINDRTRLIIINSPHNPTGSIWNEADVLALQEIVEGSRISVVSDEVYEHIIFDGQTHQSLHRYAELAKRSFIVSSFGKTYHTTGWRLGYCIAPQEYMLEFQRIHQFVNFSTNTPMQHAVADFLEHCPEFHKELSGFYEQKRNLFCRLIKKSGFRLLPAAGTYFQLLDYSEISKAADTELANRLTMEHKIASIPVSVFYKDPPGQKILRFCFAKSDATLEEAADILNKL